MYFLSAMFKSTVLEDVATSQIVLSPEQGKTSRLTRHQCSSTLADFVDGDDVDNKK